jgi:hypothetical protein
MDCGALKQINRYATYARQAHRKPRTDAHASAARATGAPARTGRRAHINTVVGTLLA